VRESIVVGGSLAGIGQAGVLAIIGCVVLLLTGARASAGPGQVAAVVPEVRGCSERVATGYLKQAGFDVKLAPGSGTVIQGQTPLPGTRLFAEKIVTLYFVGDPDDHSLHICPLVEVPDVTKVTGSEATRRLDTVGLKPAGVSAAQQSQQVSAQDPAQGRIVSRGSLVALTFQVSPSPSPSLSPTPTPTPSPSPTRTLIPPPPPPNGDDGFPAWLIGVAVLAVAGGAAAAWQVVRRKPGPNAGGGGPQLVPVVDPGTQELSFPDGPAMDLVGTLGPPDSIDVEEGQS